MSEEQTPDSAMEINALCEEQINQPDLEALFDKAGEFYDHHTGEILDRDATIAGIRAELAQMQEFGGVRVETQLRETSWREDHQLQDVSQGQW